MNEYSLKVDAYVKQDKLNTDYEVLTNKPSINGTELSGNVEIKTVEEDAKAIEQNKTDISALSENITQVLNKVNSEVEDRTNADTTLQGNIDKKQDILVSGTNIKTINNNSILGEGNITIEGGGSSDLLVPAICRIDMSFTEPTSESEAVIYYDSSYKMWIKGTLGTVLEISKTQLSLNYSLIYKISELPSNPTVGDMYYMYIGIDTSTGSVTGPLNVIMIAYLTVNSMNCWVALSPYVSANDKATQTLKDIAVSGTPTAVTSYCDWDDAKEYGYVLATKHIGYTSKDADITSFTTTSSLFNMAPYLGLSSSSSSSDMPIYCYFKDATPVDGKLLTVTLESK